MDEKKDNQKALSARLFIMMKSNKSENLDLLKKELVRGKLGKFEVAAFNIVKGPPPPTTLSGFFVIFYSLIIFKYYNSYRSLLFSKNKV